MDVGVFHETKLIENIYTMISARYKVIVMPAPSRHRCVVALFYRESPTFVVKAIRQFGVNIIVCQFYTGEER